MLTGYLFTGRTSIFTLIVNSEFVKRTVQFTSFKQSDHLLTDTLGELFLSNSLNCILGERVSNYTSDQTIYTLATKEDNKTLSSCQWR